MPSYQSPESKEAYTVPYNFNREILGDQLLNTLAFLFLVFCAVDFSTSALQIVGYLGIQPERRYG